jgi:hypothetical protein
MRDLSDIVLRPSDFPSLANLCRLDDEFPGDFDGWAALMATAERSAREHGLYPVPLLLDPREFRVWCEASAIEPCLDALRAFAIVQRCRFGVPNHRPA